MAKSTHKWISQMAAIIRVCMTVVCDIYLLFRFFLCVLLSVLENTSCLMTFIIVFQDDFVCVLIAPFLWSISISVFHLLACIFDPISSINELWWLWFCSIFFCSSFYHFAKAIFIIVHAHHNGYITNLLCSVILCREYWMVRMFKLQMSWWTGNTILYEWQWYMQRPTSIWLVSGHDSETQEKANDIRRQTKSVRKRVKYMYVGKWNGQKIWQNENETTT